MRAGSWRGLYVTARRRRRPRPDASAAPACRRRRRRSAPWSSGTGDDRHEQPDRAASRSRRAGRRCRRRARAACCRPRWRPAHRRDRRQSRRPGDPGVDDRCADRAASRPGVGRREPRVGLLVAQDVDVSKFDAPGRAGASRRQDVARGLTQQRLEHGRPAAARVEQQRRGDRPAGQLVGVHDVHAALARPLGQNLADRHVLRRERDAARLRRTMSLQRFALPVRTAWRAQPRRRRRDHEARWRRLRTGGCADRRPHEYSPGIRNPSIRRLLSLPTPTSEPAYISLLTQSGESFFGRSQDRQISGPPLSRCWRRTAR